MLFPFPVQSPRISRTELGTPATVFHLKNFEAAIGQQLFFLSEIISSWSVFITNIYLALLSSDMIKDPKRISVKTVAGHHRLQAGTRQVNKGEGVRQNIQLTGSFSHMRIACFIVQPFYKRSAQKGQRKQHCMCIKENQNNSSQRFLHNPLTLKLPLAHVWSF